MGREVRVPTSPKRIVSLVPSQTELLYDIGLRDEVIGITKFCIHPNSWFKSKSRVGGTKEVNHEKIKELDPDLIIGNREENTYGDIKELSRDYPIWMSDVSDLDGAKEMIEQLGRFCRKTSESNQINDLISESFASLKPFNKRTNRVLYLIWKDPIMVAGHGTFINSMLDKCGFKNALPEDKTRYPELTTEEVKQIAPDHIFLSSEPFPFKGRHTEEMRNLFGQIKITEVDGEMFSWYGSRLIKAPNYFNSLIRGLS
jgi:ABC-type Fe3+-hydroxamate transport system substrate-binding protein